MMEKYLNDSLREESKKKLEELASKDLMPSILKVQQHIADSLRAVQWFKMTRDSSYIKKYKQPAAPSKKDTSAPAKDQRFARAITEALLPKEIISFQKKTTTT